MVATAEDRGHHPPSPLLSRLRRTRGDVLHQDGGPAGQREAVGLEVGVPLDLDVEAEGVVPLVRLTGLCRLPVGPPVPAEAGTHS